MTSGEALKVANIAGRLNRFQVSSHCLLERMPERGVTRKDIQNALVTATQAIQQTDTKFRLEGGVDDDGESLTVVAVLQHGCLVVTVF